MSIVLGEGQKTAARRRIWQTLGVRTDEITVFCPNCKTLETVFLEDFQLMPTQKFSQSGDRIYHKCGSDKPCYIYWRI
jgi:hypothetical protein